MKCIGEATTSQPPTGILTPRASVDNSSISVVRAVSIPPSHRRNAKSLGLRTTSSIRDRLSSQPSSGIPGPGYYSGKAIKWFGEKCLDGIENFIILKRCWQHQYRLRRWEASTDGVAMCKEQFFELLEDMLELSK